MIEQIHEYHKNGMSYGKIAKVMGLTKNKVLTMHRKFRFGMSNTKLYELKKHKPEALLTQISLPKVDGIGNKKYNYVEITYD